MEQSTSRHSHSWQFWTVLDSHCILTLTHSHFTKPSCDRPSPRFVRHTLTYWRIIKNIYNNIKSVLHGASAYSPVFTGTHCAYPQRGGQAELTGWSAIYQVDLSTHDAPRHNYWQRHKKVPQSPLVVTSTRSRDWSLCCDNEDDDDDDDVGWCCWWWLSVASRGFSFFFLVCVA